MTEEQTVSPMQIYNEFITSRYGEDALLPIRKAFQNAYDIVTPVFYTLGTNLTDHSSLNYENINGDIAGMCLEDGLIRLWFLLSMI